MPFRNALKLNLRLVKRYEQMGAVDKLIKELANEDWQVRRAAARALGKLGDPRAVEPLRKLTDDKVRAVQQAVEAALERLERQAGKRRAGSA